MQLNYYLHVSIKILKTQDVIIKLETGRHRHQVYREYLLMAVTVFNRVICDCLI